MEHPLSNPICLMWNKAKAKNVSFKFFAKLYIRMYLDDAKHSALKAGYNPSALELSRDGKHKLVYTTPEGKKVRFGNVLYKDYHIYKHLEQNGSVMKGTAEMHRNAYLARATKIAGAWKSNKYSPNNLAIHILWN